MIQGMLATIVGQGFISKAAGADAKIPDELMARVKTIDAEPFLVSGMIAKVGTRLPVTFVDKNGRLQHVEMLFTKEYVADLAGQLPKVQHPEHMDKERGAFARRSNASYVLAGAVTADGNELWGKAWIPASKTDLAAEVKEGLAVGMAPAWSVEGVASLAAVRAGKLIPFEDRRAGEDVVPIPGTAVLASIDWVETGRPGVPGAGPAEIVSAQKNAKGEGESGNEQVRAPDFGISTSLLRPSPNPSKEDVMEQPTRGDIIASLTLDELKARKDLVDAIISVQDSSKQLEDLKKANAELKAANEGFVKVQVAAQVQAKRTELLATIADETVRKVAEKMLTGETVADVTAQWPGIQETVKPLIKAMPAIEGAQGDKSGKPPKGLNC